MKEDRSFGSRKMSLPSEILVKTNGQMSQLESSEAGTPNYSKVIVHRNNF